MDRTDRRTMLDYGYVWCGVYRRAFLRDAAVDFGDGLRTAEDRLFTWKLHLSARRFACVREAGYLYRRERVVALTRVGDRRQLGYLAFVEQLFALLEARAVSEASWRKAYRQALGLLLFHHERRDRLSASVRLEQDARARALLQRMDPARIASLREELGARRVALLEGIRGRGAVIGRGR
jgi:hypothetical protein